MPSKKEEWARVKKFPNYEVSTKGRVKNSTTGKMLTPYFPSTSYHVEYVSLYGKNGKHSHGRTQMPISRIVSETFR